MTALMAESPRNIDQRFFVKLLDHALMHTRGIYDLMQQHITSSGLALLEIQGAMIKLSNQRLKLLSAPDLPYVQRLNACAQELSQDIVLVSSAFRVKFFENPTPVAMRRLKHYLIYDLTKLAGKLKVAGRRAKIDFSQSIAATSRMIALMQTIPDRVTEKFSKHGDNVIPLNPNLGPVTGRIARKTRSTNAPVFVASVHSVAPALDQYGEENHDLVMNAEALPLEITVFLRTEEISRKVRKQPQPKTMNASSLSSAQVTKDSSKEAKQQRSNPASGPTNDTLEHGEGDDR